MMSLDAPLILVLAALVFFGAGLVKGVIGMGLPAIIVGLMTPLVGLPSAMALAVVPSLVTNVVQGLTGKHLKTLLKDHWPFFAAATLLVWPGTSILARVNVDVLTLLLGALLVLQAVLGMTKFAPLISPKMTRPAGVIAGGLSGLLAGMTGVLSIPSVAFLQALKLKREALVQAMGILYALLAFALGISITGHGTASASLFLWSSIGLVPAAIGMALGMKLRDKLSEQSFIRIFNIGLMALGLWIAFGALSRIY